VASSVACTVCAPLELAYRRLVTGRAAKGTSVWRLLTRLAATDGPR